MRPALGGPRWAWLTVWGIVNAVNVLQTAGFLSRAATGGMAVNHALGFAILTLGVPATAALAAFVRARAGWRLWMGPAVFVAFLALMTVVDYAVPTEFRSPARPGILVPYLVLFFGAILLMGAPMLAMDRRRWLVTVGTALALVGSMVWAMGAGVA